MFHRCKSFMPRLRICGAAAVPLMLLLQACGESPTAPRVSELPIFSRVQDAELMELAPPGSVGGTMAVAVNGKGQVVGWYYMAGSFNRRGFLWENGVYTDLGQIVPAAINERGQVVGRSDSDFINGWLWERGTLTTIPCVGNAINENGHVAGWYFTPAFHVHGCLWRDGVLTDIPSLTPSQSDYDADQSEAFGINADDEVVGKSGSGRYWWTPPRAFRFAGGVLSDLGTAYPGNLGEAWATAINDKGQITGKATNSVFATVPFIWADGAMTSIGGWPAGMIEAAGITEKGIVAGWCLEGVVFPTRGFPCVWEDGALAELPLGPYPAGTSRVLGIDPKGKLVVGSDGGHAAVWRR